MARGRPPSSSGLGRRPFKAVARVRIPLGARQPHTCARRGVRSSSPPCQGGDRGIEARRARRSEGVSGGRPLHLAGARRPSCECSRLVPQSVEGLTEGRDDQAEPSPHRLLDATTRRVSDPRILIPTNAFDEVPLRVDHPSLDEPCDAPNDAAPDRQTERSRDGYASQQSRSPRGELVGDRPGPGAGHPNLSNHPPLHPCFGAAWRNPLGT
jgi:hypothetical protein